MEKVGIVGFGLIGQKRAESILKLGHLLDLVVDPISDSESINYKSINDVPEKALEDLDVLFICLPHHLIYETFKRVSQHVPKILIEKPLGLNLNEARKIKQLSRSNQNEICCGFNYRYLRHIEKLKNLIENNFFGKIFSISLSISHGGRPGMEEEWKIKKEYAGGGVVIDPGIHLIDLARFLLDFDLKINHIDFKNRFWKTNVEDYFHGSFNAGGTDVNINVDLFSWKNDFKILVKGSNGYADLTGRGGNYGDMKIEFCERWFWDVDGINKDMLFDKEDSFLRETKDFLENFSSPRLSKVDDGLEAMKIVEKIYE